MRNLNMVEIIAWHKPSRKKVVSCAAAQLIFSLSSKIVRCRRISTRARDIAVKCKDVS